MLLGYQRAHYMSIKLTYFGSALKMVNTETPMKKVKEQSGSRDYKDAIELMFFRTEILFQIQMPFYKNTVSARTTA